VKFRSYALLIAAIVVAAALAFALPGQNGQMAALMAILFSVMTAFSAFVSWQPGASFVEQRSRLVIAAGVATAVAAICIFAWDLVVTVSAPTTSDASDPYIPASIAIGMAGFLLISAPRISRQSKAVRALQQAAASAAAQTPNSSPVFGEGAAALVRSAKDSGVFLQMAWLWLLLSTGPLLLAAWAWTAGHTDPMVHVVALGVSWLNFVVGLPTVLVAWHRWLVTGTKPSSVALPNRTAFSYGWRLWIYVGIANRAAGWASEVAVRWTQPHLSQAYIVGVTVNALAFALVCAVFGIQALRLPAVAIGDKDFSLSLALTAARKMRLALPVGVLVAFTPFLLVRVVAECLLFSARQTFSELELALAIEFGLQFLAFAASATLVSSAYMQTSAWLQRAGGGIPPPLSTS
jgi:hypothetical protein